MPPVSGPWSEGHGILPLKLKAIEKLSEQYLGCIIYFGTCSLSPKYTCYHLHQEKIAKD